MEYAMLDKIVQSVRQRGPTSSMAEREIIKKHVVTHDKIIDK